LFIRISQGVGLGVFSSLIVGFLLGVFGIATTPIAPYLIVLLTYFPSGYIAGRNRNHPYLTAGITTLILASINLWVSISSGFQLVNNIIYLFVGLTVGLIVSLAAAVLADRPWSKGY
jgi:hypothetical protein